MGVGQCIAKDTARVILIVNVEMSGGRMWWQGVLKLVADRSDMEVPIIAISNNRAHYAVTLVGSVPSLAEPTL